MARIAPMHVSIDVGRYYRLGEEVRVKFDGWLEAENLIDKRVTQLTLGEGWVTIERFATDAKGDLVIDETPDGPSVRKVTERVRIGSMPPAEAFIDTDLGGLA